MTQADTKTRILDTAERLFARDGYHTTSLRAITGGADANLAAVNYHFGSKDALLQAVIERRLLPLNQVRRENLEQVLKTADARGERPAAAELLRAFIEPTLAFRRSGPGARDFISLVGRSLSEPDETVRTCFIALVLPIFRQLFAGLQLALPELPAELLMARLQFAMGAFSHVMCMGNLPAGGFPGFPPPLDDKQQTEALIRFITAGLEAPQ